MPNDITALLWRSAGDLANLVRSGQVSSRELVEATLDRIAANAALNALTCVDADRALAVADTIAPGDARPWSGRRPGERTEDWLGA